MDLALNGKGLIVTQNSAGTYQYTRDGAFYGQSVKATATTPEHTILTTVAGNNVLGWKANADGTFTETDSLASLVPVEIATQGTFPAQATSTINLQANLSAGSEGRQTVALPFVDESGASQTLTLGFTRDQTTNYTLDGVTSSGATISFASDQVTFDSFGNIATPSGGLVQATINDPLGPQNVTIDLSRMTSLADKGGIVVQQVDQDGYIAGTLSNTYFTSNGVLMGSYSNHELRPLYKLAVANFTNNDGLVQLPGNVFVESNFLPGDQGKGAGALKLTGLGSGTIGTQFITGALEGSTVDLSDQFAKMIITQRCYSSSAKVLQVADEMTQAVRDLKR
jgi:flagellar hook protein FlgE